MGSEASPRPQRARTQPRWLAEAADDSELDAATAAGWRLSQGPSLVQSAPAPRLAARPLPRPVCPKTRRSQAICSPSSSIPCSSSPSQQQDDSDYFEDAESGDEEGWAAGHQAESPDAPAHKRQKGCGGKAVQRRNPEYTEEERAVLAHKSRKRLQDKTLKSYDSHLRKLEHFCEQHGFVLEQAEGWTEVVVVMAKFIAWVADNMPGLHYPRKKASMSFGLLRAVRNAAVLKYNQLCLTKGWSDAKALMATREFKVEFDNGCALVLPKKGRPAGDPQKNTAAEALTDEEVMSCHHSFLSSRIHLHARRAGCVNSNSCWAMHPQCHAVQPASMGDKLDRLSKGMAAQNPAWLANLPGGQLPAEVGDGLQATAAVLGQDRLPADQMMRQCAARRSEWQAAARRSIAAAQRGGVWASADHLDREEQTASEADLDQLALAALSMEEAAGTTAAGAPPAAAAAAALMPSPAAAAAGGAAAAALMPAPPAAAALALAEQASDGTVTVTVSLLQQLLAEQRTVAQELQLLRAEVCISGAPTLHRAAAAAQQDDSVSLSAASKGVFTLGFATSAGSGTGAAARNAGAAAPSTSAEGSFVSKWAHLDCNLPRNGLGTVTTTTWAATLYYEGHNNYPAWKDREEEQEQARKRGTLGERQSWRAGGQARKTWHLIQNAMRLVEEVAKMEQCTPIEAAALVDQRLQVQEGKAKKITFASLGRSDKAPRVRALLSLPPSAPTRS